MDIDTIVFTAYSFLLFALGMLATIAVVIFVDKIKQDRNNKDKKLNDDTMSIVKEVAKDEEPIRQTHYDYVQYNSVQHGSYYPKQFQQSSQSIQSPQPIQSSQPQQVPDNYNSRTYKYSQLNNPARQLEVDKEDKPEKKSLFGFLNKPKKDKSICDVKIG